MSHRTRRAHPLAALIAVFLVLTQSRAQAHLVTTGLGPLYDGAGHLVLSPECWLVPLVLGLLAGLRGQAAGRRAVLWMPAAWLISGVAGSLITLKISFPASTLIFLILGLLIAMDRALTVRTVGIIAAIVGVIQGLLDGLSMPWREGGVLAVLGSAAAAWILLTLVTGFVVAMQRPWQRIVGRVVGSWIAAIGLLMLGWWIKQG